jgi:hypothetical protein
MFKASHSSKRGAQISRQKSSFSSTFAPKPTARWVKEQRRTAGEIQGRLSTLGQLLSQHNPIID